MSEISLRSENEEQAKNGSKKLDLVEEEEAESEVLSNRESRKSSKKGQSFKKNSLVSLGLATGDYSTQFDEEDNEGSEESEAPGAFKRPESAYKLARYSKIQ